MIQSFENKIFNMPIGVSFVDEFAKGLLNMCADNKDFLANYLILLPSRRACRSLQEAFLRITDGSPLILPKMQPIGDVDTDNLEILSATITNENNTDELLNIPDAIAPIHRQLLLAKIIMASLKSKKQAIADSYIQALSLAVELGKFLDEVQTEQLDFTGLQNLVTEKEFAKHWQITLDFLTILTEYWPKILAEEGLLDPAERRNILLKKQGEVWQKFPPKQKIIVAGVTGSIPAVRELLKIIAGLDYSMIILPHLDTSISDEDWQCISFEHPQYYIKLLLEYIGVTNRKQIKNWIIEGYEYPAVGKLLSETMRPAPTTDKWQNLKSDDIDEKIFTSIKRIDVKTSQDEALVVALAMREVLETPKKTAVLVTPDKNLSKRVQTQLKRWGIACDNSAGEPLAKTKLGIWILLGADMLQKEISAVNFLSLFKHSFATIKASRKEVLNWLREFEIKVFRSGKILNYKNLGELLNIYQEKFGQNSQINENLGIIIKELAENIDIEQKHSLDKWLKAHIKFIEELSATNDRAGEEILWSDEAGEVAAELIYNLLELSDIVPKLASDEYIAFITSFFNEAIVRPKYKTHPRLGILGQMEARLYQADMVIVGAVNEGTWPRDVGCNPWMSNPMRKSYGLPPAESKIGIDAHDFLQQISAKEVLITRASNVDTSPTVPSRWLLRMNTVIEAVGLKWPKENYLKKYAENIDKYSDAVKTCERPMPTPAVNLRPKQLSVTGIEKLMRDPYSIYARYILNLKPLDELEKEFGPAERGQLIHTILEKFISEYGMTNINDGALEKLLECGRIEFKKLQLPAEIYIFWWSRFIRMAKEFIKYEINWREEYSPYILEGQASWTIKTDNFDDFVLKARADRIDVSKDNKKAVIIDYKTGTAPSIKDMEQGYSPQLPLEAVMLEKGAFDNIDKLKVEDLSIWQLSGGSKAFTVKKYKEEQVQRAINNAKNAIVDLIEKFADENTPYIAVPNSDKAPKYNDYEHLERILEWGYIEKN